MAAEPEAESPQLSPPDARAFVKAVTKAIKPMRPNTSHQPANVSEKQLRAEVDDHWKEVLRQFGPALRNAESTGWVPKRVVSGTTMTILLWNRIFDGQGPNGEEPPAHLSGAAPSDREVRLSVENENLKREIAALTFRLNKAEVRSRPDTGGDEPRDAAPVRGDGTVDPNA